MRRNLDTACSLSISSTRSVLSFAQCCVQQNALTFGRPVAVLALTSWAAVLEGGLATDSFALVLTDGRPAPLSCMSFFLPVVLADSRAVAALALALWAAYAHRFQHFCRK